MSVLVIGVDPGTVKMGVGVIRLTRCKPLVLDRLEFVRGELLEAKKGWPLGKRLGSLMDDFDTLLRDLDEDMVRAGDTLFVGAIEQGYVKHKKTDLVLAEARGVARALLAQRTDVREYAPSTVKKAVACSGRAEKAVIPRMVAALLKMKTPPQADIADALAVAITRAMDKE